MKSLAFLALSVVATAAMAVTSTPNGQITISGTSTQTATINGGNVSNTANAGTFANQNIASNKGNVTISGRSEQTANLKNSNVTNEAHYAGDVALQNLASNMGNDGIDIQNKGRSEQTASVRDSTVKNEAKSGRNCYGDDCRDAAFASQNLASNYGSIEISGKSTQSASVSGNSLVSNMADGQRTVAVQNLSSNYGNVNISGTSKQTTAVKNGAVVANLAQGYSAHAVQNIASNDSCLPPPPLCTGPACGPYAFNQPR